MCHKYFVLFLSSFKRGFNNFKVLIGLSVFLITCMLVFTHLWKIVVGGHALTAFSADELLWYIAFNQWILIAVPRVHEDMAVDLQGGRLAYLLPRPISYPGAIFAEGAGALCANLIVLGTVTFIFTYTQTLTVPFSFHVFILLLVLGLLAGLLMVLYNTLIGLSAFWLHDVEPLYWLFEKTLFMFGGLMMPLLIYPKWLQTLASFTPFPAILGGRSALSIEYSFGAFLSLLGMIFLWGAIGIVCLRLVYRRGLRTLNIGGG